LTLRVTGVYDLGVSRNRAKGSEMAKLTEGEARERFGYVPNWVAWGMDEPRPHDCPGCGQKIDMRSQPAQMTGKGFAHASEDCIAAVLTRWGK
jgi:hypothetical protein